MTILQKTMISLGLIGGMLMVAGLAGGLFGNRANIDVLFKIGVLILMSTILVSIACLIVSFLNDKS